MPRNFALLTDPSPASPSLAACLIAALLAAGTGAAQAQSWVHAQGEPRALLPQPVPATDFASAELACAAQLWTLTLTPAGEASGFEGTATLVVGARKFAAAARAVDARLALALPYAAIEPLRSGNRLVIERPDGTEMLRFPLAGSRRAITAAEALCSPRELPSANRIEITPYSSYLQLARELRAEDIADFRLSTSAEPAIRAGILEWTPERRMLFTELCGSSWYYGASGCSIVGFAAAGGDPARPHGWEIAYEGEGAYLYADPDRTSGGWPDLRAYPLRHGDPLRYRWTGEAYRVTRDPPTPLSAAGAGDDVVGGLRR